ncbi:MAG: aspartate aminotransferase family protein [Bacteroidia bacterium]
MTSKTLWKKWSHEEIKKRVFSAIDQNINYTEMTVLGVPASYLDQDVFPLYNNPLLKDAPYMSTLIKNPNHIGCHTLGDSESFFRGTQQIEKEVIEICAVDILHAEAGSIDGYVASGGTEANLQAIWIYRNLFIQEFAASNSEIAILCSEDSHYSMDKASNLLNIPIYKVDVDEDSRLPIDIDQTIAKAKENGVKHFITIVNMMTTMFGSVDRVSDYISALKMAEVSYKIHVDGAFGGFYFPFAVEDNAMHFGNPEISSVTLDAHKMAQAPYGTGIFLARKGLISYANTKEASYVVGEDYTLIGSRSGANAVAIWMILVTHGPFGWREKIYILQKRAEWLCNELSKLDVRFYRHFGSNIITIRASSIPEKISSELGLVPDNHLNPKWYKIVLMDHVSIEKLMPLIEALKKA